MAVRTSPKKTKTAPPQRPRPSAYTQLQRLQRRIYLALEREAERLLGAPPSSIRKYQRAAERDLAGHCRLSTKEELVREIRGRQVTFVGDFHTFAQSQRTALRLMREAVLPGESWALGLELISSESQKTLDDYQAGKIDTREFHRSIRYRDEWGFPWKNYEPLFGWAREHGIRLIALNRPRELLYRSLSSRTDERSGKDLHARDQWAAGIITDLIAARPGLRMLVLYGGHHIGRRHLPAQLSKVSNAFLGKPITSVSVHQNHAPLYWKLARQERELSSQVLKFKGGDAFAVLSATPWAQLQSLIACAEGEDLEDPEESPGELSTLSTLSTLSMMNAYGSIIADFLGLPRASFASLSIRTIDEADFVPERASRSTHYSKDELGLLARLIEAGERFYLPAEQIAYLASPSPNAAAEFASIHLLRRLARANLFFPGDREGFFRATLEAAFGFLGSLILNPRRKCDLPRDHERRIAQLKRGARPVFRGEREARELVSALFSSRQEAPRRSDAAFGRLSRSRSHALARWWAARAAGRILAKSLHPGLLRLRHASPEFKDAIALLTSRRRFESAFEELRSQAPRRGRHAESSKSEAL